MWKALVLGLALVGSVFAAPPGTVIAHSPASSGKYIGSPSICVLPDGSYLASHDLFGPGCKGEPLASGAVFRSGDRGATWQRVAELKGFFWQGLFVHRGAAYAMGTDREYGQLVIRRSTDGGRTWTEPLDGARGLLAPGQWHTAPVPVVEHGGRVWRAVETADRKAKWGESFKALMASAPVDADLLKAESWTFSNALPRDTAWLGGKFEAWLEGNAVVTPEGTMADLLRVATPGLPEKAAWVTVTADGKTASFDPATGFSNLPGGAKKFTIRPDPKGGGYWTIASITGEKEAAANPRDPGAIRNTLALLHSPDLRQWIVRSILLHHDDVARHGFQYVDWQYDGDDLIAACRTAWEDEEGGAHSNHDANHLTFHRWKDFRTLQR
ncbi:hypothetical protein [Luteolibacter sp. LG18]|uniref:sialidase family protein n=1 Tax=Luteolibacter sp. LG18 TaxID=2819286 RepID=UPI002B2BD7CA|nr:hypothetical protein llg_25800 [Luteolibacter sp. LG18]